MFRVCYVSVKYWGIIVADKYCTYKCVLYLSVWYVYCHNVSSIGYFPGVTMIPANDN